MKRYEPSMDSSEVFQGMVEDPKGDYVNYDDVKCPQTALEGILVFQTVLIVWTNGTGKSATYYTETIKEARGFVLSYNTAIAPGHPTRASVGNPVEVEVRGLLNLTKVNDSLHGTYYTSRK